MLNTYSHTRPGIVTAATVATALQLHSVTHGKPPVALGVHVRDLAAAAAALVALGYTWLPVQVQPGCLMGELMMTVAG